MRKLRIGFFSLTGDEGCMTTILELICERFDEWEKKLDLGCWRFLRSREWECADFDVAVVEGAVSTYEEEERLREIRKRCKKLVAVGSCAVSGAPSNFRNFFDAGRLKEIEVVLRRFHYRDKVQPLKDFVKVDDEIPGCPVSEKGFVDVIEKYMMEFGVV